MIAGRVCVDELLHLPQGSTASRRTPGGTGELALAAGTLHVDDQPSSHGRRRLGTEIVFYQCQRQVDPGGDTSRGPYVAVSPPDRLDVDIDAFKEKAQAFYEMPEITSMWSDGLYDTVREAMQ